MGDSLTLLETLFEHPEHAVLAIVAAAVFLLGQNLLKQCSSLAYRCQVIAAGLSCICITGGFDFRNWDVACLAYIVLIVVTAGIANTYLDNDRMLEAVARHDDQQNVSHDPSKALNTLERIKRDRLIGPQRERYERYRVYTHIALGNNRIARDSLEADEVTGLMGKAFRHFFLHIVAERAGDRKESQSQLNKAMAHKDDKGTDALTVLQLEHNQAVLDLDRGQYQVACDEFEKVLAKTREFKVTNRDFLGDAYHNYVLTLTIVGLPDGGARKGWEAVDEYAHLLDPRDPSDILALFNLRLFLMRQLGMSRERKNELYITALSDLIENPRFTDNQKVVGAASLGKISWSDGLDPSPAIEYLAAHVDTLVSLCPADRYMSFANLRSLLVPLVESETLLCNLRIDADVVHRLWSTLVGYMQNAAWHDLETWERSLPAEAILPRAQVLRERASLHLDRDDDGLAFSCLNEAIKLLENNLLVLDAIDCRIQLAKLAATQDCELVLEQARNIEQYAKEMSGDPTLGYIYANVGLCYALTNQRDDCLRTYDLASRHWVPLSHFDPPMRMGMAAATFCARFFLFARTMEELKGSCDSYELSEAARAWLSDYPMVWGPSAVLLLARFLGYTEGVPLARRCLIAQDGSHFIAHYWLEFLEVGIAFDPTIGDVRDSMRGRLFVLDKHPIVAMSDREKRRLLRDGYVAQDVERVVLTEEMLGQPIRSIIEEVGVALDELTDDMLPSKRKLMDVYLAGIANVPVVAA